MMVTDSIHVPVFPFDPEDPLKKEIFTFSVYVNEGGKILEVREDGQLLIQEGSTGVREIKCHIIPIGVDFEKSAKMNFLGRVRGRVMYIEEE